MAQCAADDWIVTMDADDTHPPDLIPLMMTSAAEHDASVVIASRFQPGAEWHRPLMGSAALQLHRQLDVPDRVADAQRA